jgi:hypothetical protein
MTQHVADFKEYEIPTTRKTYRITCTCGMVIVRDDSDLIWMDWQIHVATHRISELEGRR